MHGAGPQGMPAQYGTHSISAPFKLGKKKPNPAGLVGCLFVPFIIFSAVYCTRSFRVQYESAGVSLLLCGILLLVVITFAGMTATAARKPGGDARILGFLFITSLIAWLAGFFMGFQNLIDNMQPFYDIANLNTYPAVNPSIFRGNQLMDAGQIFFTRGTTLDLTKSVGFKNKDIYCIAPIVGGNVTGAPNLTLPEKPHYDFWAVGLNCCSGHTSDYHCGEFSNIDAHAGLRLMRDDQRQFFRLAVQEAEAMYNIKAPHPIFMYWMANPTTEIDAYQYDGLKSFYFAEFGFFAFQLFLTVVLAGHVMRS